MRLGIDVDGVVLDSIALYDAAFQKRYTLKKDNVWDFEEAYGINTEQVNEVLKEVEQITDVPLIPGAQILNKIVNLPHIESPMRFVTSSSFASYDATRKTLERHFTFSFLLCCGINKGLYCDAHKIDFFVEDGPPHIRDIFWNSTTRIYILDKPYNQDIPDGTCDVVRVKNWSEILIDLQREGYREAVRVSEPPHSI